MNQQHLGVSLSNSKFILNLCSLGGGLYDSDTHYGTTEEIYNWERGTNVYEIVRVKQVGKEK